MPGKQQFALVTGCGKGGIGEALVKEYTRQGLHAIATVLPDENREHLVQAGISCFSLDVTIEESIIQLKEDITALTGGLLHILVNNAGICYTMTAIDTDVKAVQRMFDINVFGPMRMVHHLHDMIIEARGTIVNIGSIGGIVPYMYGSSYNASKAALHHWSNTLRLEMSPFEVKVLTVISGEVGTNILKNDTGRELPLDSYYSPLSSEFKQHIQRTPKTTDRFDYAANVVRQSLKPSTAWFWYGSATGIIRFLDAVVWRTFWDFLFRREFNLDKLRLAHSARMKKNV